MAKNQTNFFVTIDTIESPLQSRSSKTVVFWFCFAHLKFRSSQFRSNFLFDNVIPLTRISIIHERKWPSASSTPTVTASLATSVASSTWTHTKTIAMCTANRTISLNNSSRTTKVQTIMATGTTTRISTNKIIEVNRRISSRIIINNTAVASTINNNNDLKLRRFRSRILPNKVWFEVIGLFF